MAALITHLCASTCAFTWMVIEWLHLGKPSIVGDDFSFACVCHCCTAGSEHGAHECCILVLTSSSPQASPREL
jgi:hypothetical protein